MIKIPKDKLRQGRMDAYTKLKKNAGERSSGRESLQ